MVKQITHQQRSETIQKQEEIPAELISKFDNDEELVREFLSQGYSIDELKQSTISHPTRYDPMVSIGDKCIGFWIDSPQEQNKYRNSSRIYQNRFSS